MQRIVAYLREDSTIVSQQLQTRYEVTEPELPIAVIDLCAGGAAQTRLNFEEKGISTGAYIREAQRLGLADLGDPKHTEFIPSYDQKIPQLHPKKKKEIGVRLARWALNHVYGNDAIVWETAKLVSAVPEGDKMLLTFDKAVLPDDFGSEIEGFSIADTSGIFYMANAVAKATKMREEKNRHIIVSSPLVKKPVAVRYAWARAPMGNLKVNGIPWQPLQSFRTDDIDFAGEVAHRSPESLLKTTRSPQRAWSKSSRNSGLRTGDPASSISSATSSSHSWQYPRRHSDTSPTCSRIGDFGINVSITYRTRSFGTSG